MILLLKAVRSIWDNKKAYIACIVLISIGIFMFDIMGIVNLVFASARDKYYAEYRLADVFSKVTAIPSSSVDDLQRINGIDEAAGRFVYDARVLVPNSDKVITIRLNSVDTDYYGMPINGIMYEGGSFGSDNDIMVGADFLAIHGMKIGDSINVIIEGKEYALNICAIAESPEYVYSIKDAKEFLPDPATFGFAFIPQRGLWALANKYGVYNDVSFMLSKGTVFEDVRASLEDSMKKFGLKNLYQRKDHLSVSMVDTELNSIKSMSTSIPMVFLLMSVVVLYLMLKRVIEQERTQIGVLKAFGYSNSVILLHYIMYGAITGIVGGILGSIMAAAASEPYIEMFKTYFKLPTKNAGIPVNLLFVGIAISLSSGVLGGYFGALNAIKLSPAEAMRPPAPKAVNSDFLKKLPLLQILLTSGGNMAVRSIVRNKMRSSVIVIGVVFAFGMMGFMGSYGVMMDFMIFNQFTKIQRFDAKIILKAPQPYDMALEAAYKLSGVDVAEGMLEIPVELKNKNLKTGVNLTGIDQASCLYSIYDNNKGSSYKPTKDGIIITDALSKKLDAKKGDVLYLSSSLLEDDIKVYVTEVAEQNLGAGGYMDIESMSEMLGISKTATSIIVKADDMTALKSYFDEALNVAVIEDKVTTYNNYNNMMAPYTSLIYFMWAMAVVVAFSIIYNISTISLSERQREYATLRVMGMHVNEVGAIMAFEYWILCFIGMVLGVPFVLLIKQALAMSFTMDAFTFPTFTPISAYIEAAVGCMAAVFFANRSAVKHIRRFDMVEVLKERE